MAYKRNELAEMWLAGIVFAFIFIAVSNRIGLSAWVDEKIGGGI